MDLSFINGIVDMGISLVSSIKELVLSLVPLDSTLALLSLAFVGSWLLSLTSLRDIKWRFVALVGTLLFLLLYTI